jgi:hypothetical protein
MSILIQFGALKVAAAAFGVSMDPAVPEPATVMSAVVIVAYRRTL